MLKKDARIRFVANLSTLGLIWTICAGTVRGQFTQNANTVKVDTSGFPADIQKGFRLFKVKCNECHGLDVSLKTNMPPDRWAAEVKRMQAMPSARFNDRDAKAMVDFLNYDEAHRKPPITPPASPGAPDTGSAGRKIYYAQGCDACHSLAGQGGAMPLDDVGTKLSRDELMQRMRGRRAGAVMPPLPSDTTDQQIDELVGFLVTLKKK